MRPAVPVLSSCSIGGSRIRYLYYDGDDPAMIFMHATGFMPWLWHPIAREFAGRRKIIAPWLYEHRYAEPEEGGVDWRLLAEDMAAFCDALAIDRPVLVGHSIGGTLANMSDALRGSPAPGMVLFEPIYLPEELYGMRPAVDQHPMASKAVRRGNSWRNAAEARDYFLERDLFRRWDAEMLDLYVAYGLVEAEGGGLTLACPPRHEAAIFMGDTTHNSWPYIEKARCPVLVVEGGESDIRSLLDCRKVASLFRKGSYLLIKEAGHLIPMEKPAECARIIHDFLEVLQSDTAAPGNSRGGTG